MEFLIWLTLLKSLVLTLDSERTKHSLEATTQGTNKGGWDQGSGNKGGKKW